MIWGQKFSFFPEHLIREMLFKVALHISIVVDTKTFNWFMKDNLATALELFIRQCYSRSLHVAILFIKQFLELNKQLVKVVESKSQD